MIEISYHENDAATAYVCEVIFSRWFQWPVSTREVNRSDLCISMIGNAGVKIHLGSARALSGCMFNAFLSRAFAPEVIARLRADHGESLQDIHGVCDWLDYGAVSAIFWILSGESEVKCNKRDEHDRIEGRHTYLVELGILDLPVVDLLADYLLGRIRVHFPNLPISKNDFKVVPTHDVDAPYKFAFRRPLRFILGMAADVLRGEPVSKFLEMFWKWRCVRAGEIELDPFNCFKRIMQINESKGLQSEFYFISGHSGGKIDGDYDMAHPIMRSLLVEVLERGHLVGLHSSYNAPFNSRILKQELVSLQELVFKTGFNQYISMVRNHYLRFDPIKSPAILGGCGLSQDSTLSFADKAGFRRGTCRPFPLWDLEKNQQLDIVERPLIAMECSLVSKRYEGLSHADAADRLDRLKAECRRFGGNMVVLWHNNYLCCEQDFELYAHAIS